MKRTFGILIVLGLLLSLVPVVSAQTPEPAAPVTATGSITEAAQQKTETLVTATCPGATALKGKKVKDLVIGFSQMENNNPWRLAETDSMTVEGNKQAGKMIVTDAQSQTAKQVSDIEDMIAQGVQMLFIAPREYEGLTPALDAAKKAGVPVFLVDREAKGTPCEDFVAFMGSNFIQEGERAATWLVEKLGGKGKVIELYGTIGASPAIDRATGFRNVVDKYPDIQIVASQSGDFTRAQGQAVMEQLLQANPDVNAVYAHNDEMALGAIQALKDAGKKPGTDVILVSIDGEKDALKAVIAGDLGATVECNPRFGPLAFETAQKYLDGEPIPQKLTVIDNFFDASNAAEFLDAAY
jgi:ABC-type sugar transport system substrate-binding protein